MYNEFAKYYDILMSDVDYGARAKYIDSLFCRFGKRPTLLLDLACGTGGFSNEFAKMGISVIGVDVSPEMLSVAREKSAEQNLDVLYLCQNAKDLDLFGTVDGAVCCLDSLNHIINYDEFCEVFLKVSLFLEKNSLFIFDMNTVYKQENVLSDNTFVVENDDVYCVWQNEYSKPESITDITLDFFVKNGDCYTRATDSISERAYSIEQIKEASEKAGLKIEAVLGDMSNKPLKEQEERMIVIARKI